MTDSSPNLSPQLAALQRAIEVVAKLRDPDGGCPWDLEQTPQSLIPYIIEEAYETVDALRRGDSGDISEELGDLLLQVLLQSQIASETGDFDLSHVANGIADKLIRRHPHVFGDVEANTPDRVREQWEDIKAQEKAAKGQTEQPGIAAKLDRDSRTLPPLASTMKISRKAATVGFEWDSVEGVWEKFNEELDEWHAAIDNESKARQQEELGDLLFTVVNLARWYDLDPEAALQGSNQRFVQRFGMVEQALDRPLTDYSLEEIEAIWQEAKRKLKQTRPMSQDK
ncbi:MAG: nucleoside triphosphate pyrophosphohydrolase [Geitlerinemataceae cyanobacterium]